MGPPEPAAPTPIPKGKDVMEGTEVSKPLEREKAEVQRLTQELKSASDRQTMALELTASIAETVHEYTRGIARLAEEAFDLTSGLNQLIRRSEQMTREVTYAQWAAAQGEISPDTLELLANQIRNIGKGVEQLRTELVEGDLQQMRTQGEDEREESEDKHWERDISRREDEMRRRDSIFTGDDDDSGM